MKIITTIIFLLVFCVHHSSAQDCDIATTGLAVYNAANTAPISNIQVGQNANFKFSVANFGSEPLCTIPANSVTATLTFTTVSGTINPLIYDGPATFISGYFTWTYNSGTGILTGTNTTAIPNGVGDGNILIKVKGNAPGTSAGSLNLTQGMGVSDNGANNTGGSQLIITVSLTNNNSVCPGSPASFVAPVAGGNVYQWQLDAGSGYVDISDGPNYTGTTTAYLTLSGAPTSWYGYKYKCRITNGGVTYTTPLTLKFSSTWIGGSDENWENPLNWGCSGLPDANTDVYVNTGCVRNPKVLYSTVSCRSLNLQTGTTIEVTPGKRIDITGHD
jgi:hypothetical protein